MEASESPVPPLPRPPVLPIDPDKQAKGCHTLMDDLSMYHFRQAVPSIESPSCDYELPQPRKKGQGSDSESFRHPRISIQQCQDWRWQLKASLRSHLWGSKEEGLWFCYSLRDPPCWLLSFWFWWSFQTTAKRYPPQKKHRFGCWGSLQFPDRAGHKAIDGALARWTSSDSKIELPPGVPKLCGDGAEPPALVGTKGLTANQKGENKE